MPRAPRRRPTTWPIATRRFKVHARNLGRAPGESDSFTSFWDGLPHLLAADSLRAVAGAISRARLKKKPVVFGFGAHVVKTGLSPTLIALMRNGYVTALATNGASGIHDFELAYHGATSEDVGSVLADGEFGMSRETGVGIFRALREGRRKGWGYGRALGEFLRKSRYPHRHLSIFAAAAELGLPLTVHVALGTDTLAQHPGMDGALVGEMSMRDFRTAQKVVARLGDGGVFLNVGSSVILPEVFLKALSLSRNLGHDVRNFTTVDLDMIRHYRPHENVLTRPILAGGASYAITGHHEIVLPLLAQALILGLGGAFVTPRELAALAEAAGSVTVAVVGDLMLDETWTGEVSRIAPEAPVPLLNLSAMSRRAGGAGNVVENLSALGARVIALGAVGPEEEGAWLARRLTTLPGASGTVVADPCRTTPVKRRMVSDGRQMLRVDQEIPAGLSPEAEGELKAAALRAVEEADVLLLSDYAKGTLTPSITSALVAAARRKGIPALVDPKGRDYGRYRGASIVTPNRKELETVSGEAAHDLDAVAVLGERLREELSLEALLVKLSEDGMLLLERGRPPFRIRTRAREVFDVTGAGDTVLAALGVSIGAGLDRPSAAEVANRAAGCAVARAGTAPVHWADLLDGLTASPEEKLLDRPHLAAVCGTLRRAHRRVVFTNGCFDLLHPGHIRLLTEARKLGDLLVVGLNSDASVRKLKGPERPILSERDRAQVLGGLDAVDFVVLFDEETPERLIEAVRPDVLVKGSDYTEATVVGAPFVRSYGGTVALVPLLPGSSTTTMVSRLKGDA